LKLLLDEMHPPGLADALSDAGVEATTVLAAGMAGRSDADIFATAVEQGQTVLTENVGDFTHISAEHLTGGDRHPGVIIALSSRFSRRPAGTGPLVAAIRAIADQEFDDRVVYLEHPEQR
jgi:predicted nuclease of predicted toxin-antitoxin system